MNRLKLELYKGRPADCTGRLEKEIRTYDLLDALGLEYWRTDHAFLRADTMEDCMVIDDCLGATVCKNLFLCNRQKTNFYLLLMPADKPFRTKEITSQLGCARLSFASEDAMEQLLQLTPGSATIFGLMHDTENRVQLLVDRDLLGEATFGCHPCINTSTIRMQTGDVFDKLTTALHHPYTIVTLKGE